jgi:signal peptidase II
LPAEVGAAAPRPSRRAPRTLAIVIVAVIVVADQLTKVWATDALARRPRSVIDGVLELRLARNTASAFSLVRGTPLLALLAAAVAIVLVQTLRGVSDPVMLVAYSSVLGGALGNLGDRVLRSPGHLSGAVVDFVHVEHWPTFNLADSAITVGVALLAGRLVAGIRPGHDG